MVFSEQGRMMDRKYNLVMFAAIYFFVSNAEFCLFSCLLYTLLLYYIIMEVNILPNPRLPQNRGRKKVRNTGNHKKDIRRNNRACGLFLQKCNQLNHHKNRANLNLQNQERCI